MSSPIETDPQAARQEESKRLVNECGLSLRKAAMVLGVSYEQVRQDLGRPKRSGRPKTTGRGRQIGIRWHNALIKKIEAWGAAQEDEPSRAEAIRRLVQLGLQANQQAT
jgi:hypothetical protein